MRRFLIISFSLLCALTAIPSLVVSQGVELDDFSVFQHEDEIYLSWVIARGSTCNGISIERSSDNVHFEEVGYIVGVCGNPSSPQPYSHVDANPVQNQVNYYRLELGLQGYSETRSIEYLYVENNGFQIRPNPAVDRVHLVFQNANNREHTVSIYSLRGEVILEQSTNGSFFDLNLSGIPAGVYPVRITNNYNESAVTQRLVIQ